MIVVAAATAWEAAPLAESLGLGKEDRSFYRGHLGRHEVLLLQTGMGPEKARSAAERIDPPREGLIVLSAGLAGALQPGIRTGDLVADLREAPVDLVESARDAAGRLGTPIHFGAFFSSDRVLGAQDKRETGLRRRAVAVDMESAALRAWTLERGGIFLAARAVLDEIEDELPQEAPEESFAGTLRYAAAHWRQLPALVGTGLKQRRAMSRLSVFLREWLKTF